MTWIVQVTEGQLLTPIVHGINPDKRDIRLGFVLCACVFVEDIPQVILSVLLEDGSSFSISATVNIMTAAFDLLIKLAEACDQWNEKIKARALRMHEEGTEKRNQLLDRYEKGTKFEEEKHQICFDLGVEEYKLGHFVDAEKYFLECLEIWRNQLDGESHSEIADCYDYLGKVERNQGKFDNAKANLEKAVEIYLEIYGENHTKVAESLGNLGIVECDNRNHNAAKKLFNKSLTISIGIHGPTHAKLSMIYNNMGNVEADLENLDAAKDYYEKAMSIDIKEHGEMHPDIARNYTNLGRVEGRIGDYKKAEEYYKKTIHIQRNTLGENHLDLGITHENLGGLYEVQNKKDDAKTSYTKAKKIYEDAGNETYVNRVLGKLARLEGGV